MNIASEAGRVGSSGSAAYSAAKGGVIAFTKTIAREGARYGVLCNAIAPGPIDTPLLRRAPAELGELGDKVVDMMVGAHRAAPPRHAGRGARPTSRSCARRTLVRDGPGARASAAALR